MNSRLARLKHLSCRPGDGTNVKISKGKLVSGDSSVRLSAAMRCAGVINRSFGGRWEYINK